MPRRKRKSKTTKETGEVSNAGNVIDTYLKNYDLQCDYKRQALKTACDSTLQKLEILKLECKQLLSARIGNTPLEDLDKALSESTYFVTVSDTTSNLPEVTNTLRSVKTRKCKRSSSLANDEGGKRKSRTVIKELKTRRASRSFSRSEIPLSSSSSVFNNYKAPQNKQPNNEFGFVIPKVKPNTPQVILRRPKEGELVISMQGSPLMVNQIVSHEANVNIPLEDGRTISIQPKLGLRMSQLPTMDRSIKQQIEVLRDNLRKICQMNK